MIAMRKIPYALPDIGDEEIESVVTTLKSGWLTMGPKTFEFEKAIEEYTGAKHAIAVNSCTAALHLSLIAAGIGKGDEVITTPFTFAATGNVIAQVGAKPVLVDIEKGTFNIDPVKIEEAITLNTTAIIPVHYGGQPCDMKHIHEIADRKNIIVIEDAAHAIGARYRGRKMGNLGSLSTCFSFYATKNMTTGEGGAITTNDDVFADGVRKLRLHGISKDAWNRYGGGSWKYDVEVCGWKYNTTDLNSSLGIQQLKKLDEFTRIRKMYAGIYSRNLHDVPLLKIPNIFIEDNVFHVYPLLVPRSQRDDFIAELGKMGVSCSVHFIPLHHHTFYQKTYGYKYGDFPVCDDVYEREVSIPLYPKMTEDDVMYVIECIKKYMRGV